MNISEILKLLNRDKVVSTYLGTSRQMYIKYENGDAELPLHVLKSLCRLYKVTYEFIIDDKLSMEPDLFNNQNEASPNKQSSFSISEAIPQYKPVQNPLLQSAYKQIKLLNDQNLISLLAFMKLLAQENEKADRLKKKSKKDFFDLAGKINLDSTEVTKFREDSLI